ncbi:MAG TPA: amino acid deaminase [Pseudonocardiaceae bacterium]|jgi:D-serine deaminase-like pyridoxal phosphate-dependent protein|nr:amino acid deaminase [Pseudonocardiaceae bacterium]
MGLPGIDTDALDKIRAQRVDWRFKSLPDTVFGQTIGEVADARLDLFGDGFAGPMLVLHENALRHNLTTMADWCARHAMSLAPHGKTTMAPQLFARQLELGAWGITAANISQLRVYRAFGVRRVLFANELVDAAGLRWLAAELDRDPEFEFACWVDSLAGVALMDAALRAANAARPVDVLVELGAHGGRSGVRDVEEGTVVAAAVAASPMLRLVGVAGYEGAVAHGTSADAMAAVRRYLERVRTLTTQVADLLTDVPEVIVTAGGSAYFDVVVDVLGGDWPGLNVRPVLRSGAYVTHDDGMYQHVSPLGETLRLPDAEPFRPAITAWGQVTSVPQPDLALATMGRRDVPYDQGMPIPRLLRTREGDVADLPGTRVSQLADQHAFLVPERDGDGLPVAVGDWVGFGVSHPCTTFDKWPLIPVVEGTTVVDLVRTYF